jgi:hypothetical protein
MNIIKLKNRTYIVACSIALSLSPSQLQLQAEDQPLKHTEEMEKIEGESKSEQENLNAEDQSSKHTKELKKNEGEIHKSDEYKQDVEDLEWHPDDPVQEGEKGQRVNKVVG